MRSTDQETISTLRVLAALFFTMGCLFVPVIPQSIRTGSTLWLWCTGLAIVAAIVLGTISFALQKRSSGKTQSIRSDSSPATAVASEEQEASDQTAAESKQLL